MSIHIINEVVEQLKVMPQPLQKQVLEFTWDGNDENDEASGSGWLKLKDKNTLEGKIKFHHGDSSLFLAKRA
jgi:flagellar hook assembly protein FlgD